MAHLQYLLIVFTLTVALVSSIPTIETNNLHENRAHNLKRRIVALDKYLTTYYYIKQNEKFADKIWVNMETEKNKSVEYMPDFSSRLIELPFNFRVFGLNVKYVVVMAKGGIRSADLDHQWSAIPLRINTFGEFTPCPIRYRLDNVSLTVQWEFGYQNCQRGTELSVQLKIHNDGRIDFIYKKITFGNLKDAQFSDVANDFGLSYKYEVPGTNENFNLGPQLTVNETVIRNNTVIVLNTFPLCSIFQDSKSCLVDARNAGLKCFWCPNIEICSSTDDFLQEVWMVNFCKTKPNDEVHPVTREEPDFGFSTGWVVVVIIIAALLAAVAILVAFIRYCRKAQPSEQHSAVP